jgi:NTE family protein
MGYDLILSSGYLAFARQAGFLAAIEDAKIPVDAVCGTSSGAIAGAMFAAGMSAADVASELSRDRPMAAVRPHTRPWDGLFALDAMIERLRTFLPATFDDLARPLAVGVATRDGRPALLTKGPLPEAVAASCAIPKLFAPVRIGAHTWVDGGPFDRTGLPAWRALVGDRPAIVHLVEPSRSGAAADTGNHPVVHSGKTAASLLDLGDFGRELAETHARAREVLAGLAA